MERYIMECGEMRRMERVRKLSRNPSPSQVMESRDERENLRFLFHEFFNIVSLPSERRSVADIMDRLFVAAASFRLVY